MGTIAEERKAFLEQKLKEMADMGVTKRSPEEYPSFDQPFQQTAETKQEPPQQRVSAKEQRERLKAFQESFLTPIKLTNRKAIYVSEETHKRLDFVVRRLGESGVTISSYVERILTVHLERFSSDVEVWRKL